MKVLINLAWYVVYFINAHSDIESSNPKMTTLLEPQGVASRQMKGTLENIQDMSIYHGQIFWP